MVPKAVPAPAWTGEGHGRVVPAIREGKWVDKARTDGHTAKTGDAMANDYIPRGDAEFNGWQANFVASAR
jgi:hypothetical protein